MGFGELLSERIDAMRAPLCVGLDPVLERLPAEIRARHPDARGALCAFCVGVVDGVADVLPAVKVQSACFERFGSAGIEAMERVVEHARHRGMIVILDAKRGDIGLTMSHYAASAANLGAHALTVSPYLGAATLLEVLGAGLGVFALVRTSNAEGDRMQTARLSDGRMVCEMVADELRELDLRLHEGARARGGLSDIGAVIGATKGGEASALRARLPDAPVLVPGFGAQGGDIGTIRGLCRRLDGEGARSPGALGVLVTASRSILYPATTGDDWRGAIRGAALEALAQIRLGLSMV